MTTKHRVTDAMIDAAARFFPSGSRDLARAALDAAMGLQPQPSECRHCGFLCSPNPAPSKAWHPLEPAAATAAQPAAWGDRAADGSCQFATPDPDGARWRRESLGSDMQPLVWATAAQPAQHAELVDKLIAHAWLDGVNGRKTGSLSTTEHRDAVLALLAAPAAGATGE